MYQSTRGIPRSASRGCLCFPISYTDPSGEFIPIAAAVGGMIGGAIAGGLSGAITAIASNASIADGLIYGAAAGGEFLRSKTGWRRSIPSLQLVIII